MGCGSAPRSGAFCLSAIRARTLIADIDRIVAAAPKLRPDPFMDETLSVVLSGFPGSLYLWQDGPIVGQKSFERIKQTVGFDLGMRQGQRDQPTGCHILVSEHHLEVPELAGALVDGFHGCGGRLIGGQEMEIEERAVARGVGGDAMCVDPLLQGGLQRLAQRVEAV